MLATQDNQAPSPQVFSFQCAELVPVRWDAADGQEYSEPSILAEVSPTGGVFLVEEPAEPGTSISIALPHAELRGVVRSCVGEQFSYALHVDVEPTPHWFGGTYAPDVLPQPERPKYVLPLAS